MAFRFKSFILFYVSFEFRLLPISFIVIGWGYQPERATAYLFMFMYTVAGSLPLLLVILLFKSSRNRDFFSDIPYQMWLPGPTSPVSSLFFFFLILGFLIKFPIYGVHLWLPKAHVEAPVRGSIILAGLLLKLGGFGAYLLQPAVLNTSLLSMLTSYSLAGGVLTGVTCLRQVDIKVLIAYSSVVHLRVGVSTICLKTYSALVALVLILLAHGMSSPGLFFGAFVLYKHTHSRRLLLNSGVLVSAPSITLF